MNEGLDGWGRMMDGWWMGDGGRVDGGMAETTVLLPLQQDHCRPSALLLVLKVLRFHPVTFELLHSWCSMTVTERLFTVRPG